MQNYLNKKTNELLLISKYLPNYLIQKPNSFLDALRKKEELSKELKKHYAEKYYHELTNKDRIEIQRPFIYNYT